MDVVDSGSDQGQMVPMVRQIEQRYAHRPPELLVVGGFARLEQIGTLVPGTTVYAPVPEPRGARVFGVPPVAATAVPSPLGDNAWVRTPARRSTRCA